MGDSWAMGEWCADTGRVLHTGTHHYLTQQGYRVRSVALLGSSNMRQIREARDFCSDHPTGILIWFYTDPLRDEINHGWPPHHSSWRHYRQTLQDCEQRALRAIMELDRTCLMIGGCSALPAQLPPQVRPIVQDLRGWLIPQSPPIRCLNRLWSYPNCDPGLLAVWEAEERVLARHLVRAQASRSSPEHLYFWPDGRHPNRQAHLRLTEEMIVPALREC